MRKTVIDDQDHEGPRQAGRRDALLAQHHARPPTTRALKDCDLVIEAVFEDRKVKAETIAKAQALLERRRDLRLQHLDAADHLAGRGLQGPGASSSASTSSRRSRR